MKTMKATRKALATSIVALVVCVTMLMGTTFAWFTDTATVAVNTIKSGSLKIDLVDENGDSLRGETLSFGDEDTLWEPGCRYTLQTVKLVNKGNLAAKYKVVVTAVKGTNDKADLADVIDFYEGEYPDNAEKLGTLRELLNGNGANGVIKEGIIAPTTSLNFGTLTLVMQETAGNDYQGCTLDGIAVTVYATQATVESDSFGVQYDEDAEYEKTTIVVTAKELQDILNAATDADSGDNTVTIAGNIKLADGENWTPVKVDGYNGAGVITVDGNGAIISGLNAPLFAGGFAGASGIIIKDLTIADSNIVSTNNVGSGAFIEAIDSMPTITLTNCHLKDSTVTGSRTGGLIGWNSGYSNESDGPVKTYVTIENCSVVNCKIIGAGTVGGIVGHAGASDWTWNTIKDCKVENCKLTSNDDSYRVGAILGTANIGHVVIEDCTSIGNTIVQNNNGTEIARPEGQSELYGRTVLGTTGSLTIDNQEIK